MSQVISFKCPSCGGYLVFDPVKQRFQCPYCGGSFAENELKEQSEQRQQAAEQARSAEPNSELRSYHCQMCGAEIVTDTTTAATRRGGVQIVHQQKALRTAGFLLAGADGGFFRCLLSILVV